MIFNIQRYSTHDGKGIRTMIFFKGCPLRCRWCSNPESQNIEPEIFFFPQKCILCLECVNRSKNNEFILKNEKIIVAREFIKDALLFKDVCPTKAIEVIGNENDLDEIVTEVKKDIPFFTNSDGGVTISGGEGFMQPDFLQKLLIELKKLGIHISIETCLNVPWENIEPSLPYIDLFLLDLKHTDKIKFKKYTDGDLDLVFSNIKKLKVHDREIIIRIPVIPGFNDVEEEMASIIDFASTIENIKEVNFLAYHTLGSGKYTQLGLPYDFSNELIDKGLLDEFIIYSNKKGLKATIGG